MVGLYYDYDGASIKCHICKIISAALIRGRRSLKKFDLECGAYSGGGAQTSKYGI